MECTPSLSRVQYTPTQRLSKFRIRPVKQHSDENSILLKLKNTRLNTDRTTPKESPPLTPVCPTPLIKENVQSF